MSSKVRVHHAIPPEAFEGGPLTLSTEATHYLLHVHRLRAGDAFEVFDGRGRAYPATLVSEDPAGARAALDAPRIDAGGPPLVVVQALLKADKLEWVLQKGTELGASAFELAATKRSVAKAEPGQSGRKLERWQKICEEGSRQCGRSDVPTVRLWPDIVTAAREAKAAQLLLLDEAEAGLRLSEGWRRSAGDARRAVLVGPEGGWERDEVDALEKLGALRVSLGARILRAETASMAALAVLQHLGGSFG
jgi:16S rRNA (uracil1498-N3)-methyltransferase